MFVIFILFHYPIKQNDGVREFMYVCDQLKRRNVCILLSCVVSIAYCSLQILCKDFYVMWKHINMYIFYFCYVW